MARVLKNRSKKAGLPPGTLVNIGERLTDKSKITIINFDEEQFLKLEDKTPVEYLPFKDTTNVTWVNVDGIDQAEMIERIANAFDLHPLLLEDIMNTDQRPKMEMVLKGFDKCDHKRRKI